MAVGIPQLRLENCGESKTVDAVHRVGKLRMPLLDHPSNMFTRINVLLWIECAAATTSGAQPRLRLTRDAHANYDVGVRNFERDVHTSSSSESSSSHWHSSMISWHISQRGSLSPRSSSSSSVSSP